MSATARYDAIRIVSSRQPRVTVRHDQPQSALFGTRTFGSQFRSRLPHDVRKKLQANIETGAPIDYATAQVVAHALKEWALENGATHFCHWFQPMTGVTAEKHDSFLTYEKDGVFGLPEVIERFSGKELVQGEPDASSFPSGGLRATFEARGYTAWDPGTPPFLLETANGLTLCIPTAFISYTGETLDEKTPLLRSLAALNDSSLRLLQALDMTGVRRVTATVGPEQEYFLVDRAFHALRPDLVMTGRTVFGAAPSKGQELEDQYFGSIRERVLAAIMEVERELVLLGIPVKTRHNEVAPAQVELAVIYGPANRATDQNQIIMETIRRVAARHDLVLVIHEKPFHRINGSGKHNNWSLATNTGDNLLEPGDTPAENLRFLCFLAGVIRAVHRHGGLLRASVASAANDHRLGANEAPPAIMSVFLGDTLTKVLDDIEKGHKAERYSNGALDLGVPHLPQLSKDNTDRNRTSPFAFTGNKFEFRAVGASANIAWANTVLNAAVAESLDEIARRLHVRKETAPSLEAAVLAVLREVIAESRPVLFNGDNYSAAWHAEAERRGLANDRDTPTALRHLHAAETRSLFETYHVLAASELEARLHISLERYTKALLIEGRVGAEMIRTGVLPAATRYLGEMAQAAQPLAALGIDAGLKPRVEELARLIRAAEQGAAAIEAGVAATLATSGEHEQAVTARDKVLAPLTEVREAVDRLEQIVPDDLWPYPKYREMLFLL